MATISKFEDILIWQNAYSLTIDIYSICKYLKDRPFKDQIQRASVSIMNNIAEGFERKSNKEFRQFLFIAKGSCGEVRSMLRLSKGLNYIEVDKCENLIDECIVISKMLSGLIKKL